MLELQIQLLHEATQVTSTKEEKNIEDAHKVLFVLLPALPPPEGVVDDFNHHNDDESGGQKCEHIILQLTRCKGRGVSFVSILLMGHNPIHELDPGSTTCDFSSKGEEMRMKK